MVATRVPFAHGVRAAAAVLGALMLAAPLASGSPSGPTAGTPSSGDDEPQETTAEGRQARPDVEPPPASRGRLVFVCDDAGTPVFADRPCGPSLTPRSVSFTSPASGAAVSILPPVPRATTRPRRVPAADARPGGTAVDRCTSMRRQLDELDERMRAGYTSREAARLWNRWRELKARLRSQKC